MLTKKGRHIAYIGEPAKDKAAGKARKSGFLDAMADAGIRMDRSCMYETELCMQGGYEKAAKIWKTHPEVDSLFCATDSLAVGALRYFHEHDIQVPQQVQIVAFGDTEIGSAVSPAISSVHFYHKTMGQEVARMLVEILESGDDLKKHLKMGYQIVKKNRFGKKRTQQTKTVAAFFFDLQKAKYSIINEKGKRGISCRNDIFHQAAADCTLQSGNHQEREKRSCRFRMA